MVRVKYPLERLGGLPGPSLANLHVDTSTPQPSLTVDAQNAVTVGYAIRITTGLSGGGYSYAPIGLKTTAPHFTATWNSAVTVSDLTAGGGDVELAAVPCLAGDVPAGAPTVDQVVFQKGRLASLKASISLPSAEAVSACLRRLRRSTVTNTNVSSRCLARPYA